MKRHWMPIFIIGVLLSTTTLVSPAQAANANTFVLSNEGGGLISEMVAAGYGDYNPYDALVAMQGNTDPSIAGIVTPAFLATLQSNPASSPIFTHPL